MFKLILLHCILSLSSGDSLSRVDAPGDNFHPGWTKSNECRRFEKNNLYGYINGGAELFREFGFVDLSVQTYRNGDSEINLELYRMESPEAALGIYLMKCGQEMPDAEIKARNSSHAYQLTLVKADYFIVISNFSGDESSTFAMTALAQWLLPSIPEMTGVTLLRHLPEEGLVAGSERIIRGPYGLQSVYTLGDGDILHLGGRIYGVIGEYRNEKGASFTRIIVPYPDEEASAAAYYDAVTNLDSCLTIVRQQEGRLVFKDFQNQFGRIIRDHHVIEILLNLLDTPF